MEITSQPLSSFIGDNNQTNAVFGGLAKASHKKDQGAQYPSQDMPEAQLIDC